MRDEKKYKSHRRLPKVNLQSALPVFGSPTVNRPASSHLKSKKKSLLNTAGKSRRAFPFFPVIYTLGKVIQ